MPKEALNTSILSAGEENAVPQRNSLPAPQQRLRLSQNAAEADDASRPALAPDPDTLETNPEKARMKKAALTMANSTFGQIIKKRKLNADPGNEKLPDKNSIEKFMDSSGVTNFENGSDILLSASGTYDGLNAALTVDKESKTGDNSSALPTHSHYQKTTATLSFVRTTMRIFKSIYGSVRKHGWTPRVLAQLPNILNYLISGRSLVKTLMNDNSKTNTDKYLGAASSIISLIGVLVSQVERWSTLRAINADLAAGEHDKDTETILKFGKKQNTLSEAKKVDFGIDIIISLGQCAATLVSSLSANKNTVRWAKIGSGALKSIKSGFGLISLLTKPKKPKKSSNEDKGPSATANALTALFDGLKESKYIGTDDGKSLDSVTDNLGTQELEDRIHSYEKVRKLLGYAGIGQAELLRCENLAQQNALFAKATAD